MRSTYMVVLVALVAALGCDNVAKKQNGEQIGGKRICTPGVVQCNASLDALEVCRAEGYGFVEQDKCQYGCNVDAKACNSVCKPGTQQCVGDELQTCKADGSGWDSTTCANGCSTEKVACFGTCTPGATRCNGDKLETCSAGGNGFTEKPCGYGCNSRAPVAACYQQCRPGSQKCNVNGNLATCLDDGSGYSETTCDHGCDATKLACFGGIAADAGSNQVIMQGDSVTLTASATGGTGSYVYSWTDGNGNVGIGSEVTLTPTETTTYTVTVSDGKSQDTAQVTVTVEPRLTADAGSDKQVLLGQDTELVGTYSGGVGAKLCAWFLGGAVVSAQCDYIFGPVQSGTYVLEVTDSKGHKATDTVEITVFAPLKVSATAKDPKLFAGESTTLMVQTEGGITPIKSCTWNDPANSASCASITVTVDKTTTYTVLVTDAAGNTAKAEVTVEVVTLTADAPDEVRVCYVDGFTLTVVGQPIGGIDPTRCEWYDSLDNKLSDACTLSTSYPELPQTDTQGTLKVYDFKGHSASKTVQLKVAQPLGYKKIGVSFDLVAGQSVSFNANDIFFGGFEDTRTCSYSDKDGIQVAKGCDEVSWTPTESQTYTLTVGDGTCPKADYKIPVTVHAAPTLAAIAGVHVANGESATVSYDVTNTHPGAYCLLNVKGQTDTTKVPCSNGTNNTVLSNQTETTEYEISVFIGDTKYATQGFTVTVLKALLTAEPNALQSGQETKLSVAVTGNVGTPLVCQWRKKGDGTSFFETNDCTSPQPQKPTVDTVYEVLVTDTDKVGTVAEVSVTVGLVATPQTDLYYSYSLVQTASVTLTWAGGDSQANYACSFGVKGEPTKAVVCSGLSLAVNVSRAKTQTYVFTVEQGGKQSSIEFTVHVLKVDSVTTDAASNTIDPDQSVNLSVTHSGSKSGTPTCVWTDEQANVVPGDCNGATVAPKLTTTYTVTVSDTDHNNQTISTSGKVTVKVNLLVNQLKTLYVTANQEITIVGSWKGGTTNPNGKLTCSWSVAYGNQASLGEGPCDPFSSTIKPTFPSNGTVSFKVTDFANPAQSGTTSIDVYVLKVTAKATPSSNNTPGSEVILEATPVDAEPGLTPSCVWTDGANQVGTDCKIAVNPTTTTKYDVTLTVGSNTATTSVTAQVLSLKLSDAQTVPRGTQTTLTASVSGLLGSATCAWKNDKTPETYDTCTITPLALEQNVTWSVTVTDTTTNAQIGGSVNVQITDPCTDKTQNGYETAVDCGGPTVWFNEIHYDNTGGDVDEGFELAGPNGLDLTGWKVLNWSDTGNSIGNNTHTWNLSSYANRVLVGTGDSVGVRWFGVGLNQMVNTEPRGLMLVDAFGRVQQFLCYGTSFTVNYNSTSYTCASIGVVQGGSDPVGNTMQLTGTGNHYQDFSWVTNAPGTRDQPNTNQTFTLLSKFAGHNICGRCAEKQACGGLDQSCMLTDSKNFSTTIDSVCSQDAGDVCVDCSHLNPIGFEDVGNPPANSTILLSTNAAVTPWPYEDLRFKRSVNANPYRNVELCGIDSGPLLNTRTSPYLCFAAADASTVTITFPYPVTRISFDVTAMLNYDGLGWVDISGLPAGTTHNGTLVNGNIRYPLNGKIAQLDPNDLTKLWVVDQPLVPVSLVLPADAGVTSITLKGVPAGRCQPDANIRCTAPGQWICPAPAPGQDPTFCGPAANTATGIGVDNLVYSVSECVRVIN